MAEDKKPQTAGTVLERLGMGTPWSANQTAVADAVRSGNLSRADVNTLTSWQLGALGGKGYTELYPEVFGGYGGNPPRCPAMSPAAMEIASLTELRNSLIGAGMEIYRTMIDNRISSIRAMYSKSGSSREREFLLPDWMRPLLGLPPLAREEDTGRRGFKKEQKQSTISAEEARNLKLSPLGAQTELSVDQQKYLSTLTAWLQSGAPSGSGMGTVGGRTNRFMDVFKGMTQSQGDYWTEYQRKSQSMFPPSQRLGVTKRVASQ